MQASKLLEAQLAETQVQGRRRRDESPEGGLNVTLGFTEGPR